SGPAQPPLDGGLGGGGRPRHRPPVRAARPRGTPRSLTRHARTAHRRRRPEPTAPRARRERRGTASPTNETEGASPVTNAAGPPRGRGPAPIGGPGGVADARATQGAPRRPAGAGLARGVGAAGSLFPPPGAGARPGLRARPRARPLPGHRAPEP